MPTVWLVKGQVTDPEMWSSIEGREVALGETEWQFSDGPIGDRGASSDYLSLEEGLADHSGFTIIFEP